MHLHCLAPRRILVRALTLMLAAPGAARVHAQPADDFVPVTDAMLENPAPADWLMWRRTLNGWGYSSLEQIDRDNVGDLRLVWTRALAPGSQQGTPLAYGGILYMPNPNDVIQAIDAVTGDLRWECRGEHRLCRHRVRLPLVDARAPPERRQQLFVFALPDRD